MIFHSEQPSEAANGRKPGNRGRCRAVGVQRAIAAQAPQRLDFPFKDGPSAIQLPNKLVAHEEVSRGYRFVLEVLSDDSRIPLEIIMGKMVAISLNKIEEV